MPDDSNERAAPTERDKNPHVRRTVKTIPLILLLGWAAVAAAQDSTPQPTPPAPVPIDPDRRRDGVTEGPLNPIPLDVVTGAVLSIAKPEAVIVLTVARDDGETAVFQLLDPSKIRDADGIPIHYTAVEPGDRVVIERGVIEPSIRAAFPYEDVRRIIVED